MAEPQQHVDHDLDHRQQRDARKRAAPSAVVVYEAIRREAESELTRPLPGLWFSALAACLSMGFSMVALASIAAGEYEYTFVDMFARAIFAGWLVAVVNYAQVAYSDSSRDDSGVDRQG